MRGKTVLAGLVVLLAGTIASAQDKVYVPSPSDIYCSGTVTNEAVPRDTFIITGEESNYRVVFNENDSIYVNKGASQGVKVGDEFSVIRAVKDPYGIDWTKWQSSILQKMGTVWEDEGRVRVTKVLKDTAIGQVEHSCDYVQRGDILLPFVERHAPTFKPDDKNFDRFAPANGKPLAMIITGKKFQQAIGREDVIYVNLGSAQGVKVGQYFRIFRYTGTQNETVYHEPRYAFDQEFEMAVPIDNIYGFGSVSKKYNWSNVPREDIGEGIVLRTGPNSSTVLVTFGLVEIYPGDYVEIE